MDFQAEVVWISPGHAGLRWLDLSDRQRRWLEQRIEYWKQTCEVEVDEGVDFQTVRWIG